MIHPFQPKITDNWKKHPDRLDHVRQTSGAANLNHRRAQKVVQSENVHDIKVLQTRAAIALHGRVPTDRVIAQPGGKVDGWHAVLRQTPAKGRALGADLRVQRGQTLLNSPIGGKHGNLMPALLQALRQRLDLDGWPSEFQKGRVSFRDVQDPHCSRRIFFRDLAKTLKRNSFSTRSRPRSPILCANAGSESSVSMQVAS